MTCRTLLPWPPSNKKPLQLSKMPLSLVGNFCSEKTRGSRWSRHPPGTPKDFKTNWIFMSWSFLRRLVKLFLPEDLRRPTCESFTYFPNWLCFKAFVWALPVHGDDLQIYIYTMWYGLSEVTDMFQLGILSQATGLMSRCPYFAFAFLDCIAPSIHE